MALNLRILNVLLVLIIISEISGQKCGLVNYIDPKILAGAQTTRGAWPFIVALYYTEQSKFFCGGTVISTKHVLTAAHCIQLKNSAKKLNPEDISVLLGAYNLELKIERGTQQREVDEIHVHPDWRVFNDKYDADIAILVLMDIVEFTNYIRPICMPSDDNVIEGASGTIVGWGISDNTTANSHEPLPREAATVALSFSYCYTANRFVYKFSSNRTFCGGCEEGTPNKGDSGGGFFVYSNSAWVQLGIISASLKNIGDDLKHSLSIYTDVKSFTNWIDETVRNSGGSIMTVDENMKTKIDLECNYEVDAVIYYKCSLHAVNVNNPNIEVDSFTGQHKDGYNAQNVSQIWFWVGKLEYIPDGIGKKFENLLNLFVGYIDRNLGLMLIKRSNFKNMNLLWFIQLSHNNIHTIDEDTLWDLPSLTYFGINKNNVKLLHKNTFKKNPKLKKVDAMSNQLEFLDSELFSKNLFLEEANFGDNKLKTISIDFTDLPLIKTIDFTKNLCIDKALKDVSNLTEYQSLLRYHCGGLNNVDLFLH